VAMISDVAELLFSSSILKTALFVSHTMTGWARCVDLWKRDASGYRKVSGPPTRHVRQERFTLQPDRCS
jgi:hypothetical protein